MTGTLSGTYTIVSAKTGDHRTVGIQDDDFEWMTNYKPAQGTRVVKAMFGSDNERLTSIGTLSPAGELRIWKKHEARVDFIAALRYLLKQGASEQVELGKNYAVRSGRCYICNRKLTTPASVFYGYGPECAVNNGLPYDSNAGTTKCTKGEAAASSDTPLCPCDDCVGARPIYACKFCGDDDLAGHACSGALVAGTRRA